MDLEKLGWRLLKFIVIPIVALAILIGIGCLFCVDFVDSYEIGYKYNAITGEKPAMLPRQGYFVTWPVVVKINTIDLRPSQGCMNANNRVLNCKLLQFDTAGFDLFISWHGRQDYTINSSAGATYGNLTNILMSYAFDGTGKKYPFLRVIPTTRIDTVTAIQPGI